MHTPAAEPVAATWPDYPTFIQRLMQLELPPSGRAASMATPTTLQLRRIWPHSAAHFTLEYADAAGQRVVGQWVNDEVDFWHLVKATARASALPTAQVVPLPAYNVLLQLGGADRKLPGLAALVVQPDAELIVHHPERRAVIRLGGEAGVRYAKVVRPSRVADLATVMRTLHTLAGDDFATPAPLAIDEADGVIVLSALAGASLYDLLGSDRMVQAASGAGKVLHRLHQLPPPAVAGTHTAVDEVNVLNRWLDRLAIVAPALFQRAGEKRAAVFAGLASGSSPAVLLHRDFYDKQIFFAPDGGLGLLDFDTLAIGEAALDLANALVHWELRSLQGACTQDQARAAAAAFCASYPIDRIPTQRLQAYADATRLRLTCVYACRPAGLPFSQLLLERVGTAIRQVAETLS
jgi:aminoglycoside phosphotransferase (APT) family kinase protein